MTSERIIIVGAGLVGSVLAVCLAERGFRVDVYERSPDARKAILDAGKSINITLCERGLKALDEVGAGDIVRRIAVPAYGRLIHSVEGELTFQPYGNSSEAIYSVSRNELNRVLLEFAASRSGIRFFFEEKCTGIDFATNSVEFRNSRTSAVSRQTACRIIGADGAYSAVRLHLQRKNRFNYSQQYWHQGYKELIVPAQADGGWTSEKNVLHIWPRGDYMLIGFPNTDGSFTCALHLPFEGELSFDSLKTEADLLNFFRQSFPDVITSMKNLVGDFFTHPPGFMVTIKCAPWSFEDKILLIGDAAHAIYPSYGQGANAGFEDCLTLAACVDDYDGDWKTIFREYERRRRPNTDAIADLCIEHFDELRSLVGEQRFLLRKKIERRINQLFPDKFKDLYSMITFTCLPYTEALRISREQNLLTEQLLNVEDIEEKLRTHQADHLIAEIIQAV
ncbi:MAG TPA: NAD(P)/FAD-dependent oxidoreductase [Pyrinomonadaceae bacterium]|nr:NAD(P)/FAD-dependent oxidoreductase [Pyrinomonadaceae bacterium]